MHCTLHLPCIDLFNLIMENYSIKAVLWVHKKNKTDIYRIKIMATINRKQTYILTPYRIHLKQWDKEKRIVVNHDNANVINVSIRKEISILEDKIVTHGLQGIVVSKRLIKGQYTTSRLFFEYAKEVRWHGVRLNQLKKFRGDQILISDIDVEFLRKYESFLRQVPYQQNTINTNFKYIQRIIRQAKKEKIITENPFDNYSVPRYVQTDRIYLVDSEIKLLVDMIDKPMNESMRTTLCYFLLGCYTGMRHGDWHSFNKSMIEGKHLKFRASKNHNHVVMPIGKTLRKIINKLLVMPPPFSNSKCNVYLKAIAHSAGIEKDISTHSGRHSFGYMCASNGMTESTTAALMGISASIVKVYFHLSGRNITDQAAVLWKL